jgi:hypothetical protein
VFRRWKLAPRGAVDGIDAPDFTKSRDLDGQRPEWGLGVQDPG